MSSAGLFAMNSRNLRPGFTFALLVCLVSSARADVRLPAIISDNMVLQQKMAAPIWGWADDGEEVKVTFRGKTTKTKAKNGKWIVKLSRLSEGGPMFGY
jgi:sialate O-acetylesterase